MINQTKPLIHRHRFEFRAALACLLACIWTVALAVEGRAQDLAGDRQALARISHQDAEHKVEKGLSLTSCGALIGVFRAQTALGAPWLVFSASARTCSLEWCSGYALRS